jgi:Fe2+ transport system protein B
MTSPITQPKNKRFLLIFVLPLVSCLCSSLVGIVLGQMGNLLYKVAGESATCLAFPVFCGLFLVTFGLSFLVNKLLRKWLSNSGK